MIFYKNADGSVSIDGEWPVEAEFDVCLLGEAARNGTIETTIRVHTREGVGIYVLEAVGLMPPYGVTALRTRLLRVEE